MFTQNHEILLIWLCLTSDHSWDWFNMYYPLSLQTPTPVIWAFGKLPKSQPCSLGCFFKRQSWVEDALGMTTEFVAWMSQHILPWSTNTWGHFHTRLFILIVTNQRRSSPPTRNCFHNHLLKDSLYELVWEMGTSGDGALVAVGAPLWSLQLTLISN